MMSYREGKLEAYALKFLEIIAVRCVLVPNSYVTASLRHSSRLLQKESSVCSTHSNNGKGHVKFFSKPETARQSLDFKAAPMGVPVVSHLAT